ncbi:MAG: glycosyltransferase [Tepidisphaeraceae bacterium]|jgi:glycosyltransferase involved in cell wall biosynthesis
MRVLICHNFYQQPGGEDQVFAAETELLRRFGHDVETHAVHNDQVESRGRLKLAAATVWNGAAAGEIARRASRHRAQIVHFHNTFPLLSPAVYSAARKTGAAVVQTLHNYRLICPAATLFRDGKPCEKCLGRLPLPGVAHGCYRGSRSVTAVAAAMLTVHRALGTWADQVDAYIALTKFARGKFLAAGFDGRHVHVKPNFLDPDPGEGPGDGGFALFVGRLTEEKGIRPMLQAWKKIGSAMPLKICGDGPLAAEVAVEGKPSTDSPVEWLGRRPLAEVIDLMGRASLLVFPSLWYEGFPRTIVESFARGTPVVASDLGSMGELVHTGRTGALFDPGDPDSLARTVLWLRENPIALRQMRREARREFLSKYDSARNHRMMQEIYHQAAARRAGADEPELVAAT